MCQGRARRARCFSWIAAALAWRMGRPVPLIRRLVEQLQRVGVGALPAVRELWEKARPGRGSFSDVAARRQGASTDDLEAAFRV